MFSVFVFSVVCYVRVNECFMRNVLHCRVVEWKVEFEEYPTQGLSLLQLFIAQINAFVISVSRFGFLLVVILSLTYGRPKSGGLVFLLILVYFSKRRARRAGLIWSC